jgi:hypothetical protein
MVMVMPSTIQENFECLIQVFNGASGVINLYEVKEQKNKKEQKKKKIGTKRINFQRLDCCPNLI